MDTSQMMKWIDDASYENLLRKWRFTPSGSPYFEGEVGEYYIKIMTEKKEAHPNSVQVSKDIGWE